MVYSDSFGLPPFSRSFRLQASLPAPSLFVYTAHSFRHGRRTILKGVSKLSRKVLQQQQELQLRCSLIRSTLQLDTVPTQETVRTFAEHLLAELEQMMHFKTYGCRQCSSQGHAVREEEA